MRPHPLDDQSYENGMDGAGAMADLILGTTGILLVVLVALGPAVLSRQAPVSTPDILALPPAIAVEGHGEPVLLAGAEGLVVAPGRTPIPVSGIATSPELTAFKPARALLIIEPGGLEAAFHASARLAALGVGEIDRVRLDGTCADIRRLERQGSALVLVCLGR